MLDLEENGCPQVEETDALVDEDSSLIEALTTNPLDDQSNGENLEPKVQDPQVINPVSEEDIPEKFQESQRSHRWNGPFTARMKVSRDFVLVTLKKSDSEETQSFYIPVRW